ncbi:MAG: hypothetical protein WC713_06820, partial [Candidatus Methylomirabilota bacterium]
MSGTVRETDSGEERGGQRRCLRCSSPIEWRTVRLVGRRAFCGEFCAITWLADEAARTAWSRTAIEMDREVRGLTRPLRVQAARLGARLAQARLDRRLRQGPQGETLPWLWVPTPKGAAALLLVLLGWGAAGGPSPETRAMVPEPKL